jgi:hypothetical protein
MTGSKEPYHRICKHIRLLIIAGCLLMLGCQDVGTTWSAEVRSPDGHFVAAAQTQQWGGPGTAYDATTVDLRRVGSSQAPMEILGFSHQYSRMNLEMKWLTPTHLEVAYGPSTKPEDSVSLDFQVVKIAGIDVSVRNLSDQKVKSSQ